MIMLKEISWWIWAIIASLLLIGLTGVEAGFEAAMLLSILQTISFEFKELRPGAFPVQIQAAYTLLLLVCFLPGMRWLYWLPTASILAWVLFGYCGMARILSLMPWNRDRPLSTRSIVRTFFDRPIAGGC